MKKTSLFFTIVLITACIPITPEIQSSPLPPTQISKAHQYSTYYIRMDGGSPIQCTGLENAAYPGEGTGQACAWNHPFWALPPEGTPLLYGGDTLIIESGEYMMGIGAPGSDACDSDYPWECTLQSIPAGPSPAQPTRILGKGWDSGCNDPPQLWGMERANQILNLDGADNVVIDCLDITDHSNCIEFHAEDSGGTEYTCKRDSYPYGNWASDGIFARDASNVHLTNLNIHGLANTGVRAGRLTDWTVQNVRIAANGWAGWDGDLPDESDSNSGDLLFTYWTVEWNGCSENWPDQTLGGCWSQTAGGYGDGVGTGATGGNWIIKDSEFLHNTADGLDLLYHSLGGTISLDRVWAEGNAGNQIKITGQSAITNSVLIGNCAFFQDQPFTYNVDHCRALGNTLEFVFTGGERNTINNTSIYGQGDGLLFGEAREGFACNGEETITGMNNIFHGDRDFNADDEITFMFYQENCSDLVFESDFNIFFQVKDVSCGSTGTYLSSGENDLCADPKISSIKTFNMIPKQTSPAVDSGNVNICPSVDSRGKQRPVDGDGDGIAICDRGAFEITPLDARIYLPVTMNTIDPNKKIALLYPAYHKDMIEKGVILHNQ
ncbi:MAG: hypothetical protein JXA42_24290 [Anaerolineales bacterium]|nr:hypothetical protein [Anaerolineales bacterium]